jgi:hypothetical protein
VNVFLAALASRAPAIIGVLLAYAMPYAAYVLVSRRFAITAKLGVLAVTGATIVPFVLLAPRADIERAASVAGGLAYFTVLAVLVHRGATALGGTAAKRALLYALSFALFVVVPGIAARDLVAAMIVVALGWELSLKAYSFGVDTHGRPRPLLRDTVFFIVVNPCLVWATRVVGNPDAPALRWPALARLIAGVVPIVASYALVALTLSSSWFAPIDVLHLAGTRDYAHALPFLFVALFARYWAASGRASVDIALMRMCGYMIPERYDHPYLARSPADFWRRWNTYVMAWLRTYVFFPAARVFQRGVPVIWAKGLAVVATFFVAGALHEAVFDLRPGAAIGAALVFFAVQGIVFLAFIGFARRVPRVIAHVAVAHLALFSLPMLDGVGLRELWSHIVGRVLVWWVIG